MLRLLHGDCLKVLPTLPDNSIDSIVTDPPYGLSAARNSGKKSKGGFMGKKWDYDVPAVEIWQECLRVLKPGGHLLCFASTRTQHRMATNIEDAGFEVRDLISWIYGSGFPKNHNIEKAIGKLSPTVATAKNFSGWGTALKPAMELITLARKPFTGTVAANVLEHGTGGINVDGCRIGDGSDRTQGGRFPANVTLDEEAAAVLDEQSGERPSGKSNNNASLGIPGDVTPLRRGKLIPRFDTGGASRFFYCPKANKKDRTENKTIENKHPTVKPTKLMQYLCRLVTPVNGVVLDPFAGSGTTGKAARLEGFNFIGVELEEEYFKTAQLRLGLESK